MKRFYCSICKRVKRVRSFPSSLNHNQQDAFTPTDRIAQCNRHSPGYTSPNHPSKPINLTKADVENTSVASFAELRRIKSFKKSAKKGAK